MSDKINCLIVDDEPIAREILRNYCHHLALLHVVASCGNALEAKTILQTQSIDIIFLDINMPVLDGIAFFKTLRNPPQIIFTTAYKEYALDAFDLSACDYLLKPFSLERFIVAVDKALERLNKSSGAEKGNDAAVIENKEGYIFIKTDGKIYKIQLTDLLYAEANGNYTKIVATHITLLPTMTFSAFEEMVPPTAFIRIHRSYIINKARITHTEGNRVFIHHIEIPIGNNYKDNFMKQLGF